MIAVPRHQFENAEGIGEGDDSNVCGVHQRFGQVACAEGLGESPVIAASYSHRTHVRIRSDSERQKLGADTELASITTEDIDRYRESMVEEGRLSARSINKRLTQLHAIFKRAQRVHGLAGDPVEAAERQPQQRSGDIRVLAPDEVELIAAELDGQDAALIRVAAYTGLRLGELRALRWSDVDWLLRIVHVRRSYTGTVEGPPKSGKVRSVPLPDQAAQVLESLSRRKEFTEAEDLVFVSPAGDRLDDSKLR